MPYTPHTRQMMNTIEYRVDCQLLQYLHYENNLGCRWGSTCTAGTAGTACAVLLLVLFTRCGRVDRCWDGPLLAGYAPAVQQRPPNAPGSSGTSNEVWALYTLPASFLKP